MAENKNEQNNTALPSDDEMMDVMQESPVVDAGDESLAEFAGQENGSVSAAASAFMPKPMPTMADAFQEAIGDAEHDISFLSDVEVTTTVELGRTIMPIREVLKLRHGSVIELDKLVGQPADLLINNTLVARGEVIVVNERFGFRVTKFLPRTTV